MADTFDPSVLVDTEYTGDLNRQLTPIPEGTYYGRVKEGSVKAKKGISKAGNAYCVCDMQFVLTDEDVKAATKLEEPTVFASIFLDLTPSGAIETKEANPNANVQLGRLKHALGLREGKPWSLRSFEGLGCYIRVVQEPDADDIENIRNRVTGYYREPKSPTATSKK
jgi:hypothetical protein